jgi:hypothetical protein
VRGEAISRGNRRLAHERDGRADVECDGDDDARD